jgi:hypothetical protein
LLPEVPGTVANLRTSSQRRALCRMFAVASVAPLGSARLYSAEGSMRRTMIVVLGLVPALASAGAPMPEGRWEGTVQIPGRALAIVVDLKADPAGAWTGSIILPGLGVKGAALKDIAIKDGDIAFALASALGSRTQAPPSFEARLDSVDVMTGRMHGAGLEAPFKLARSGPAQVEAPPASTSVSGALEGEWAGEFELGGYPRQVTIAFENHRGAAATAQFLIVGKQRNVLPVELVVQDGAFVRVESPSTQINFEGRLAPDSTELRGVVELGPMEIPLALHRAAGRTS